MEKSIGCICDESIDALIGLGLEEENGWCSRRGVIVETCRGLRFFVPCGFSEHAWANIIHIACMDDYGILEHGVPQDGNVVDAGSGFGYFAAAVLQLGAGRVAVVEPGKMQLAYTMRNLEALGLASRAILVQAALWRRNGKLDFYEAGNVLNSSIYRRYIETRGEEIVGKTRVKALSPASLLEKLDWKRADLFKIDIEGAEKPVIEAFAAEGLLGPRVERLIVETHSPEDHDFIASLLKQHGYELVSERLDPEFSQYFIYAVYKSQG